MKVKHANFIECAVYAVITIVVVAILGTLIFSAVSNHRNKIDEGIIVDKQYTAEYSHYSTDRNGGHFYRTPASYSFTIEGEKDGEIVRYTFDVTKEEYDRYKIGDYYKR